MKISELISKLSDVSDEHGDIDVVITCRQDYDFLIETTDVCDDLDVGYWFYVANGVLIV